MSTVVNQPVINHSWTKLGTAAALLTGLTVLLSFFLFPIADDTAQITFGVFHLAVAVLAFMMSRKLLHSLVSSSGSEEETDTSSRFVLLARVFCTINAVVAVGYVFIGLFILMAFAALVIAFS